MMNHDRSYKFSWLWLLPNLEVSEVSCLGWSIEDSDFIFNFFKKSSNGGLDKTNFIIINIDGLDINLASFGKFFLKKNETIVIVGSLGSGERKAVFLDKSFMLREYAMLPNSKPRVLIPLSSRRATLAGLQLHRPGRWIARGAIAMIGFLAAVGMYWPLRRRTLVIASNNANFMPVGAAHAGVIDVLGSEAPDDYALYLGNPQSDRKTVVLPLVDGVPVCVLKMGENPVAMDCLRNEALVLDLLAATVLHDRVPLRMGLIERSSSVSLYQSYRKRATVSKRIMDKSMIKFVGELNGLEQYFVSLEKFLSKDDLLEKFSTNILDLLNLLRSDNSPVSILLCRGHGDLAPWNCSWTKEGVFVFDWETSRQDMLALGDAFYYKIAPAVHIKKNPRPAQVLQEAFDFAVEVAVHGKLPVINVRVYLALWLLQVVDESDLYPQLIDVLVQTWDKYSA